jgi:hypothetical protein
MNTAAKEFANLKAALVEQGARIKELESKLERLRPPSPPPNAPEPNRHRDGAVTVTLERVPLALPSESDLRKLLAIVTREFPQLKPKLDPRWIERDEREYFASFRSAFFWLNYVIRADAIDKKRDAEFWMALGEQWLRAQQFSHCTLQINTLTAAVVSLGDIPYAPLDQFPSGLRFGLTGFTAPQCLPGRWREVLRSGQAPLPVPDRMW